MAQVEKLVGTAYLIYMHAPVVWISDPSVMDDRLFDIESSALLD